MEKTPKDRERMAERVDALPIHQMLKDSCTDIAHISHSCFAACTNIRERYDYRRHQEDSIRIEMIR